MFFTVWRISVWAVCWIGKACRLFTFTSTKYCGAELQVHRNQLDTIEKEKLRKITLEQEVKVSDFIISHNLFSHVIANKLNNSVDLKFSPAINDRERERERERARERERESDGFSPPPLQPDSIDRKRVEWSTTQPAKNTLYEMKMQAR